VDGGVHVTDVTNASRTLFMDLDTLQWDEEILGIFGVPASMMPAIKSSSEVYGTVHTSQLLREVPVAGILGTSRQPPSARPRSRPVKPRTPTAPAAS
jgi:glycerol kinase